MFPILKDLSEGVARFHLLGGSKCYINLARNAILTGESIRDERHGE